MFGTGLKKFVRNKYAALSFDGSDYIISANNDTTLNGISAYTIIAWFKKTSGSTSLNDYARLFHRGSVENKMISLSLGGSGFGSQNGLLAAIGTGSALATVYKDSLFSDNTLTMAAVVFDGGQTGNDRLKLACNGLFVSGATYSGTLPASTQSDTTIIRIGSQPVNFTNGRFRGYLNNVMIYNTALSEAQLTTIYNLGENGTPDATNLIHHWPMNEGTGTTTADAGSSPNTMNFGGGSANPTWVLAA